MRILDELENTPEQISQRAIKASIAQLRGIGESTRVEMSARVDDVLQNGVYTLADIEQDLLSLQLDLGGLGQDVPAADIQTILGKNFHKWLATYAHMVLDEGMRLKVKAFSDGSGDMGDPLHREVLDGPIGPYIVYAVEMEKNLEGLEQALNLLGKENKQKFLKLLKYYTDAGYILDHGREKLGAYASLPPKILEMIEPALLILWEQLGDFYERDVIKIK